MGDIAWIIAYLKDKIKYLDLSFKIRVTLTMCKGI